MTVRRLRDRKPAPTLWEFAEVDFMPFTRSTFAAKKKTLKYYEWCEELGRIEDVQSVGFRARLRQGPRPVNRQHGFVNVTESESR